MYFSVLEMYFSGIIVFSFWTELIVGGYVQFLNWTGAGNGDSFWTEFGAW